MLMPMATGGRARAGGRQQQHAAAPAPGFCVVVFALSSMQLSAESALGACLERAAHRAAPALWPPPSILRRDADTEVERIVKLERHYYAVLKVGGADLLGEKQIASSCRGRCQAILRGGEPG